MFNKRALLLSPYYEVINFVSFKKTIKLIINDKVEIISNWNDIINWDTGSMKYPSILRLKKSFSRNYLNSNFNRGALIKRDDSSCQYCNCKLARSQVTIDHIIPKAQGGTTTFTNCVVACHNCNNYKGNQTPEQAHMKLIKKPTHPSFLTGCYDINYPNEWFDEWDNFIV